MIQVENLYKSFGDNHVLKGVTATFHPGITNIIIGGSGSGKTTLLKCLIGLYEIDQGDIYFNHRIFSGISNKERIPIRKEIGMLFQNAALFESMNVEENVMFALNMFSNFSKSEKLDRVNFCLERVNLQGKNLLKVNQLSGGMKKRVGIARAIALSPKYLFCDEPNSGLDPKTSILIDELILEITQEFNITTVINTHDMNSVMEIGQNIIFLHQGKKIWEGSKEEIVLTDNTDLNDFVFATKFLQQFKKSFK